MTSGCMRSCGVVTAGDVPGVSGSGGQGPALAHGIGAVLGQVAVDEKSKRLQTA